MTYDGSDSHIVSKWFEAAEVASFRLCVVGLDGAPTPLDIWPKALGETEIREAVEESAARHCNVFGGSHAYVVQALEKETGAVVATHPFRVSAEALPGASVLASEPANIGGITAQLMRHQEAIIQSTVLAWDKLTRTQNGIIDRGDKRAARSEAAYMRVVDLHQELIERSEERKNENRRADALLEIKRSSAEKVTAILPVLAQAVVGKVAPQGLDRMSANTARMLFESMSEAQLGSWIQTLDETQQAAVFQLMKDLATAEEKPEKEEGPDAQH